jgi:hypothetical protein
MFDLMHGLHAHSLRRQTVALFRTEERKKDLLLLEQGAADAGGSKAAPAKALIPKAVDADDEDEPESDSSSDSDDDDEVSALICL